MNNKNSVYPYPGVVLEIPGLVAGLQSTAADGQRKAIERNPGWAGIKNQ